MATAKDKEANLAVKNDDFAGLDVSQFDGFEGEGLDNISATDMVIPRITVLQSLSPAVVADEPLGRIGDIFNVTTSENYGRKIGFIALAYWPSRTKWETREINSPVDCVAPDAMNGSRYGACESCRYRQWEDNQPPFCTEFKNILMIPKTASGEEPGDAPFVLFAGKRAAIRPVNRFLTSLKMLKKNDRVLPIWASVWEMTTESVKGPKGNYASPVFKRTGFITTEQIPVMKGRFDEFSAIRAELQKAAAKANENAAEHEEEGEGTQTLVDDPGY